MEPFEKFLFLVVVGGRSPKANVELHDVRWVIGTKIEDTFDQLRNDWFGSNNGLHICLLYTSPSPRDATLSRMPSSA